MKYFSTRDASQQKRSFTEVLLEGLAPDGGLYVPETYPEVSKDLLTKFRYLTYKQMAYEIISLFVGDAIESSDLKKLIHKTYSASVFGSESVTPVEQISNGIYLQDLSTGPSLAFKDLAMQFLGHAMDYELSRRGQTLTILGASSGDTVSAAEEAMRGKECINVVMLTPRDGMSSFQKAQAGSILDDNIFNIALAAPFDRCQDLVKSINKDIPFKQKYKIGAVNSINWGRICAQIVYYFKGYLSITNSNDEWIDAVVPSGNFGNVLAAYIAKKMGLPIRRLIVSTNENDVLDVFFKTGTYQQKSVKVTSSPSMDISKASNIERYFFDLLDRNANVLSDYMSEFETTKQIDFSELLAKIQIETGFFSGASNHQERLSIIQKIYQASQRVIDPHTAAGVKVALEYQQKDDSLPYLCVETAKPTKFEEAIQEALGFLPKRPAQFIGLEDKQQRFFDLNDHEDDIKSFIVERL